MSLQFDPGAYESVFNRGREIDEYNRRRPFDALAELAKNTGQFAQTQRANRLQDQENAPFQPGTIEAFWKWKNGQSTELPQDVGGMSPKRLSLLSSSVKDLSPYRTQISATPKQPGSIDAILAQKVNNGEISLEKALEMKGSYALGGMTTEGQPVFYNAKNPSNVRTGEVPGGGILYPKTPPEGAMNASLFGERATQANQQLEDMVGPGFDPTNVTTGATRYLPNIMQPANMQKFQQAKTNFVNAVLRKESGALISNEEMASADKQYFPQVGDSQPVLEQKKINRQTAIEGLTRMAGPMRDRRGISQGGQPDGITKTIGGRNYIKRGGQWYPQ